MTRKKAILAIAIVLALGAGAAAYALRPRPQAGEVLKIGAVLANPPASDGARSESVRQGFALAQKDLEKEWAGAVRLELVYMDSGGSAALAREKLDDLHKQGVDVIAEIVGDDVASGCAAEVRKNKMLVMSAIESAPELGGLLGPTSFRMGGGESAESVELAHWARELRAQRPLVVGTPSTKRLVNAFAQAFGGLGRDLMLEIAEGGEGAQQVAERAALRACDVVVLLVDSKTTVACLKALRESAVTAWVLASHVLGEPALISSAKDLLKRALFLTPPPAIDSPRRAAVAQAWRSEFGSGTSKEPDQNVFLAYDALQVLSRAARDATGDVNKTTARLRAFDYDGCTGRVAFDENNNRKTSPSSRFMFTDGGAMIPFSLTDGLPQQPVK